MSIFGGNGGNDGNGGNGGNGGNDGNRGNGGNGAERDLAGTRGRRAGHYAARHPETAARGAGGDPGRKPAGPPPHPWAAARPLNAEGGPAAHADTQAPSPKPQAPSPSPSPDGTRGVPSLCPYCGVGCQVEYQVRDGRILYTLGRWGPSNEGRLCVKGRFGYDYAMSGQRLTQPLVRRDGAPKTIFEPSDWERHFRVASWDEALDRAADGLRRIRDEHGGRALAGFGSAKGSNEEAYLFQKLVRAGFGTNNVDHCTRLCHASSVAALMEMIGSGAVSNPVADVKYADVFIVIGANPTVNHPVAATFMKNAVERGAKMILIDPRATELARLAEHSLQFRPGSDVALLNAMMHVVVHEELYDQAFIHARCDGWDELRRKVQAYPPEAMAEVTGVPAATIRDVARLYATAENAMIFWGMGIAQHTHGTDNARALIDLALITGHVGRRGAGLHPLRGQNNVQGASDMGLIPMVFPDYGGVEDATNIARFEKLWDAKLDTQEGLTVVEIMHAARRGEIRGMYIMGENPAMSDPDLEHAREAIASLEHLVVQEIFLTETACLADVVLPASAFAEKDGTFTNTDRRVQLGRRALPLPGQARQDLDIIQELARRIGLPWRYADAAAVWEEIREAVPSCRGITWDRLEREHSVTYPCRAEGDPGTEVLFTEDFPTPTGRAKLVAVDHLGPAESPDDDYPFVLITGRILEHWHTGAMTRRASVLEAIEPLPMLSVHPATLERLGVDAGDPIVAESRRGRLEALARMDPSVPGDAVFLPFCYAEAAANLLTSPRLDPYGKIPEFKYSAIRLVAGSGPVEPATYSATRAGGPEI